MTAPLVCAAFCGSGTKSPRLLFPFMMEEFGELDEKARLFVMVCESVVKPKAFDYAKWKGIGRPKADRMVVFKADPVRPEMNPLATDRAA